MAEYQDECDVSPQSEYTNFNPEFVTELSNELEHAAPHDGLSSIDACDDKFHEMTASYSEISFDSGASLPDIGSDFGGSPCSDTDFVSKILSASKVELLNNLLDSDTRRPNKLELQKCEAEASDVNYHQAFEDLNMEGTVTKEGDMVLFVTEDLETKIKLSSPVSRRETPSFPGSRTSTPCLYRQALMPQLPVIDPNVLNDLESEVKRIATSVDTLTENLAGILHSVSALTVDCLEIYCDAVCKTCDAVDSNIKSMYQLMAKCEELSKCMEPIYKLSQQLKGIKRLLDLFENAVNV